MLGDVVVTKEDLGKVLHGLSQVLHAVVGRVTKRLSMRDKAKDKSIAAKEQQVAQMKQEAEAMREALFKENVALKGEKAELLAKVRRRTPLTHTPASPLHSLTHSSRPRQGRRARVVVGGEGAERRRAHDQIDDAATDDRAAAGAVAAGGAAPGSRAAPPPPPPPPPRPVAAPSRPLSLNIAAAAESTETAALSGNSPSRRNG